MSASSSNRENMQTENASSRASATLVATVPSNLPRVLTPLIGREREIQTLRELILREDVPLVTITGFGGAGKTTLALHVASSLLERFNDGVYFVNLTSVTKAEAIPLEVAHTLKVPYEAGRSMLESLKDTLERHTILLILDNFEHIMPGAGFVLELLEMLPHCKIIVTSRDPLRLRTERIHPLSPLATDDAVRLFIQRARSVKPDFQPNPDENRAIAELCERLGGLPLAVELAALRAKLFTPQAMLTRLQPDLEPGSRFLNLFSSGARDLPERQQSLRKTIAWSYSLLTAQEQRILRAASVFPGGFGVLTLVKYLDMDEQLVLEMVDSLADKNLIKVSVAGESDPRFSMLEAIREFLWDEIRAQGELEEIKRRYIAYYLDLAQAAEFHMRGAGQTTWLDVIDAEYANLMLAMDIGAAAPVDSPLWLDGMWILCHLEQYWMIRALFNEFIPLSNRASAMIEKSALSDERARLLKANLFSLAGTCAWLLIDHHRAMEFHEASLAIYRELGDESRAAFALNNLAVNLTELGDQEKAVACYFEGLSLYEKLGDHWGQTRLHWNLANHYTFVDRDMSKMAHHDERGLYHAERSGDIFMLAAANLSMGELCLMQGESDKSQTYYQETVDISRLYRFNQILTNALTGLASLALLRSDLSAASDTIREGASLAFKQSDRVMLGGFVRLGAWLSSLRKNSLHMAFLMGMHESLWSKLRALDTIPDMWDKKETALEEARAQLGDAVFDAERERGRVTPLQDAVAFLLDVCLLSPPSLPPIGDSSITALTERETKTLLLLAQGRTNKEISRELFVTLKTVEKHTASIFRKLGVANRAEAAAWAAKQGMLPIEEQ